MSSLGKRGTKRDELKLRLLWNLIAGGIPGPKAVEYSGLPQRTAYNYISYLLEEGALRRITVSPAIYEPTPEGLVRYKSVPGSPVGNLANDPEKLGKPPIGWGRDTPSHAQAPDGPVPGPQEDDEEPGPDASTPSAQGPQEAPAPRTEEVKPAPPTPLDHQARVHHLVVKCQIVKGPDRSPQLDMLQWSPMKYDVHNNPWYRQCQVLFDDIGTVTIQEFPNHCVRIWLPEQTVNDRRALERAVLEDPNRNAQRVANWLQRNYGYRLGLPEAQDTHVAFGLPDIGGSFKGWLKVRANDGTWIVIDQSKEYAEIEILVQASRKSEDLRRILAWANAPTLLVAMQGQVMELKENLPQLVLQLAGDVVASATPTLVQAVDQALIPEVTRQLKETIETTVQQAVQAAVAYQPGPQGPGDNTGYG